MKQAQKKFDKGSLVLEEALQILENKLPLDHIDIEGAFDELIDIMVNSVLSSKEFRCIINYLDFK